ncbi:MAG: hypothetical protein COV46_03530 [Deltaproteobacteria bacterium CG11_big_fil_rev_8_21_14_0_20_49_13]|nr:MAG: hypothetical protein COV46_03530 [Deltaproteobacteria bacterium CG11_big_fil_rev_8_21_14_0_20_49_13]
MDKHNWYFRFLADVDWLESHHQDIDHSMWNLLLELTQDTGVIFGMEVTERGAGPNFSVDTNSGVAYDTYGRRIINNQTYNIPFIEDANGDPIQVANPGDEKIVSVYVYYHIMDKEPAIDGFGDTVYQFTEEDVEFKLYQGAEDTIGNANPPPNPGDGGILLAHVTISFGDGTIEDADIDTTVKEELKLHGDATVIHNFGDEDIEGDKSFINGYDLIFYSDDGLTETARVDGETGNITTIGTVDGVDVSDHVDDATIHFTEGSIEHGNILGLDDDDHPQYTHKDQNETISQIWTFNENIDLAGGKLVDGVDVGSHIHTGGINGPIIQHHNLAGLGDDDHPQYAQNNSNETIGGAWTFNQAVVGQNPVAGNHLATKSYVDGVFNNDHGSLGGLGDNDHPQYLLRSGGTLTGNVSCNAGVTVDGVNINIHTHSLSLGRTFIVTGKQTQNIETDDMFTIGGFTSSDMPVWGICQIDMTQGGGGFDADNKAWIGGPGEQVFDGHTAATVPTYSGGNWQFRIRQRAGNENVVCAYNRSVIECTDSTGGPS